MATRYGSPEAFRQALEQRLRNEATAVGYGIDRLRQLLVFDRFLARITQVYGDAAVLQGGIVLELRLERARTTKDIDLRLSGRPDETLAHLQRAGRLNLGDHLAFEVRFDPHHPDIRNEAMRYEGFRFRVAGRLAGRPYGSAFGLDVAFGQPMTGEPAAPIGPDANGSARPLGLGAEARRGGVVRRGARRGSGGTPHGSATSASRTARSGGRTSRSAGSTSTGPAPPRAWSRGRARTTTTRPPTWTMTSRTWSPRSAPAT